MLDDAAQYPLFELGLPPAPVLLAPPAPEQEGCGDG
jgi:hypothetical protein